MTVPISLLDMHLNVKDYTRTRDNIIFGTKVLKATRHWHTTDFDTQFLRDVLGLARFNSWPVLSNINLRTKSPRILAGCIRNHFAKYPQWDGRFYFFTFAPELGFTSDRTPTLNARSVTRNIQTAHRAMGLSAIGQLEIHPIVNWPQGGLGRTLMLHGHTIAWGDVPEVEVAAVVAELNLQRCWRNPLDATPIVFRALEGGINEAVMLAYYLDKLPTSGKNRAPLRRIPGEYRFWDTQEGYRPELALRVMEALSQFSIFDAVFSVGDGVDIRRDWRSELFNNGAVSSLALHPNCAENGAMWGHIRQHHGSKLFRPMTVNA
ncbi:MAG: hypothetical protein JWQ16_898 [Novosphingobium sp.]|nr:hypothetical protein [Novosphingobium sp.]